VHCGSGSWGGQRPSMGDYVTGTGARGRGERRRRVLMLPTLTAPWIAMLCAALLIPCAAHGADTGAIPLATGQHVTYTEAFPSHGFPRSANELQADLAAGDQKAIRRHGWEVWAAITQPAPKGLPAFLTWYTRDETYGKAPLGRTRDFHPEFMVPEQRQLGDGDAILNFNTYNKPLRDHIRRHRLQNKAVLKALVGNAADVPAFPDNAVTVKTVWWPVRRDGLTAFPVWDDDPTRPVEWGRGLAALVKQGHFHDRAPASQEELARHEHHGNDFETFRRVVIIDPAIRCAAAVTTAQAPFFGIDDLELKTPVLRGGRIVPLSDFFHLRIAHSRDVATIRRLPLIDELTTRLWGRPFQSGDYVVLIAAHVTTRELPDWVWSTFWWHDEPAETSHGGDQLPDIPPPFRHFRMETAYSADSPHEPDGRPKVIFNPYLEGAFSYGPKSNCLACHQRAVVTDKGFGSVFPVVRGGLDKQGPFFKNKVRTDQLWSLAIEPFLSQRAAKDLAWTAAQRRKAAYPKLR
jgi:hypothetical protein